MRPPPRTRCLRNGKSRSQKQKRTPITFPSPWKWRWRAVRWCLRHRPSNVLSASVKWSRRTVSPSRAADMPTVVIVCESTMRSTSALACWISSVRTPNVISVSWTMRSITLCRKKSSKSTKSSSSIGRCKIHRIANGVRCVRARPLAILIHQRCSVNDVLTPIVSSARENMILPPSPASNIMTSLNSTSGPRNELSHVPNVES
mmetsp:Transcript_16359/g.41911  ORF Transcript_16359/g.41911 Transcript_16359/m.41911 type:complete len:203 (-) Transcript_16359:354-962(-)